MPKICALEDRLLHWPFMLLEHGFNEQTMGVSLVCVCPGSTQDAVVLEHVLC